VYGCLGKSEPAKGFPRPGIMAKNGVRSSLSEIAQRDLKMLVQFNAELAKLIEEIKGLEDDAPNWPKAENHPDEIL